MTKMEPKLTESQPASLTGKRTIKMTEGEAASFQMLRGMGRTEKQALEFIERERGHQFTDQRESRVTFASLSFKPHRSAS